jgi:hypothetical protein
MSKNTIELNEDYIFNLKKVLKSKGRKATIPDVVDYALEFTLNSLNRLDEETIEIVEPKLK